MSTQPNKKGPSEKSRTTEPQEEFIGPEATPSVPMTPPSQQPIHPGFDPSEKPRDEAPKATE
ncbi:MAG: hypothetical protein JWL90_2686 [Chthoniobacteraceae bacterium]|nr:hypothetical protein [Chthoniobacteraceae bacterium]